MNSTASATLSTGAGASGAGPPRATHSSVTRRHRGVAGGDRLGCRRPDADGADADAVRPELRGQRAGEGLQPALGRRVHRQVRPRQLDRARGDVHDVAASGRHHQRDDGAAAVHRAEQVRGDRRRDVVVVSLGEERHPDDPGVVHQGVDSPEVPGDGGERVPHRVGIADVARHGKGAVAEVGGERGQLVFRPGEQRDAHPCFVEDPGHGGADALRRTSDHRDLALEAHGRDPTGGRFRPALTPGEISDILTAETSDI